MCPLKYQKTGVGVRFLNSVYSYQEASHLNIPKKGYSQYSRKNVI